VAGFLVTVAVIWALAHGYAGSVLVPSLASGTAWRSALWLAVLVLWALPFAAFAAARKGDSGPRRAVAWAGYVAMGFSSVLVVFTAAAHLAGALEGGWSRHDLALGVLGASVLVTALGMVTARRRRLVRVAVPIAGLHTDLDGLRIVQISDLHLGHTLRRDFAEGVVADVNGLDADLVAVTGDLADGHPRDLGDLVAPFHALRSRHGVYFVTGNHEYFWDPAAWLAAIEALGMTVLDGAHRVIRRGEARIVLAGVADGTVVPREQGPEDVLSAAPSGDLRVLLAHQPRDAFAAARAGFQLQLSGHTHGGQYFPFNLLVRLFQPFVAGLHRIGGMWVYVSRGTGYWGPPLRVGAPAEVTVVELRRAEPISAAGA
jgi:predicted MPP superfamily phosphohydrolase